MSQDIVAADLNNWKLQARETSPETGNSTSPLESCANGSSLSLDRLRFFAMVPLHDQILQKLRAIIRLIELEDSHTSVVSFFHDSRPR